MSRISKKHRHVTALCTIMTMAVIFQPLLSQPENKFSTKITSIEKTSLESTKSIEGYDVSCPAGCARCFEPYSCQSCVTGYYLYQGQCYIQPPHQQGGSSWFTWLCILVCICCLCAVCANVARNQELFEQYQLQRDQGNDRNDIEMDQFPPNQRGYDDDESSHHHNHHHYDPTNVPPARPYPPMGPNQGQNYYNNQAGQGQYNPGYQVYPPYGSQQPFPFNAGGNQQPYNIAGNEQSHSGFSNYIASGPSFGYPQQGGAPNMQSQNASLPPGFAEAVHGQNNQQPPHQSYQSSAYHPINPNFNLLKKLGTIPETGMDMPESSPSQNPMRLNKLNSALGSNQLGSQSSGTPQQQQDQQQPIKTDKTLLEKMANQLNEAGKGDAQKGTSPASNPAGAGAPPKQ